jgi:anti-sigma factor ChrR (cupin superfamily)
MMEIDGFGTLVQTQNLKWIETPGGNSMKILRVSEESGSWSALFRAARGTTNPPHVHLGPADFFVLSGVMEYRGGVSRTGDWIYEPNGAEHEATHHPEETIYLANVHGAIAFYGDVPAGAPLGAQRPIIAISDWRAMKALQGLQQG